MMKFNFKTDKLPFDGFEFGGRSYAKEIADLDADKGKNGYGIIGNFIPKDEDVDLKDGHLYLSVSRGGESDVTHLFTIKDDKPLLIKESKAQRGAIRILWDEMEKFIEQRPKKSPQQLLNWVKEQEQDRETLKQLGMLLLSL